MTRSILLALTCLLLINIHPALAGGGTTADEARKEQAARTYFTDLEVVTQDGQRLRFYSDVLKDRVVLINFVHTRCKNACPMMTRKLTLVRDRMEAQLGHPLQFVSISLDPERDTPAALKEFARRHEADHAGWVFLTGKVEDITQIIRKFGQYSEDLDDHSTILLAGNVKTAHWTKISPSALPDDIAAKLRELVEDTQKPS
jgi:cytochrome oxidase Cu insertion factor (SCO1/SenC/PrrC family)